MDLTVGTVMTPFPVVVDRDTPLDEVAELLAQNDITGAPVVDGDGKLVGVISQTDLVRTVAADSPDGHRWAGFTARHVMCREPVTSRPSESCPSSESLIRPRTPVTPGCPSGVSLRTASKLIP